MLFNDDGINLQTWKEDIKQGDAMNINHFIDVLEAKNFRNAVFADVTANADIASSYNQLLEKSISVVACNKIACSSEYSYYKSLKDLSYRL